MEKSQKIERLLWLDMEMTGLDVEREVPIEIGAIVTGWELEPLASYHSVIRQPQSYLDQMDDWNKKHHGQSGLLALIPNGQDMNIVEDQLLAFCDQHMGQEPLVLAGNSIFQDRLFISKYFKRLAQRLHYRMLDVTSWKIALQAKQGAKFNKANTHRATEDIIESINEFKFYLSFLRETVARD